MYRLARNVSHRIKHSQAIALGCSKFSLNCFRRKYFPISCTHFHLSYSTFSEEEKYASNSSPSNKPPAHSHIIQTFRGVSVRYSVEDARNDSISKHRLKDYDEFGSSNLSKFPLVRKANEAFKATFLPTGYPETVGPNYSKYIMWQALSNVFLTMNSVIASACMLYAVGLGSGVGTSATAGALSWILKDGLGQLGTLVFGKVIAHSFDVHSKSWNFISMALLTSAAGMEVATVFAPGFFLVVGALANTVKGLALMAGSSTRSVFSLSFARDNNIADVTAKGTSQYILASLVGTSVGAWLSALIGQSAVTAAMASATLSMLTLFTAYRAATSVPLSTLNSRRLQLVTEAFLRNIRDESKMHRVTRQAVVVHVGVPYGGGGVGSATGRGAYGGWATASDQGAVGVGGTGEGRGLMYDRRFDHHDYYRLGLDADLDLDEEEAEREWRLRERERRTRGGDQDLLERIERQGGEVDGERYGGAEAEAKEGWRSNLSLRRSSPSGEAGADGKSPAAAGGGSSRASGDGGAAGVFSDCTPGFNRGLTTNLNPGDRVSNHSGDYRGVSGGADERNSSESTAGGGSTACTAVDRCFVNPHLHYDEGYDDSVEAELPTPLELGPLDPPLPYIYGAHNGAEVIVGSSLDSVLEGDAALLSSLLSIYRGAHFMVVPVRGSQAKDLDSIFFSTSSSPFPSAATASPPPPPPPPRVSLSDLYGNDVKLHVILHENADNRDIIQAYLQACIIHETITESPSSSASSSAFPPTNDGWSSVPRTNSDSESNSGSDSGCGSNVSGPSRASLRAASLRVTTTLLRESFSTAERLTSVFMISLRHHGWTLAKVVVEAERRRAKW